MWIKPGTEEARLVEEKVGATLTREYNLADILKRPEANWAVMTAVRSELLAIDADVAEQIEIRAKYAGYIERQKDEIERQRKQENTRIRKNWIILKFKVCPMKSNKSLVT